MKTGILCAFLALSIASSSASETFSVKLNKKPLDLRRVLQQRQTVQDRYLDGTLHGGEDIKLLDFMDAQVT